MLNIKRSTLFLSLLLALTLGACGTTNTGNSTPAEAVPTIFVTGLGEAIGEPDIATINLGINITGPVVVDAVAEANEVIESIGEAVQALGVAASDVTTVAFNVWPDYRWDPETGQQTDVVSYHVDGTVRVVVRQVESMGEIISAGLEAGANNLYGIDFSIDDTQALEAEARVAAVADAQMRAEALASEMGVSVGDPITISESSYGMPVVGPVMESAAGLGGGGGGGGAPISPGQMMVQIQVTVAFELVN
jgi:uncharacterized protein YggE